MYSNVAEEFDENGFLVNHDEQEEYPYDDSMNYVDPNDAWFGGKGQGKGKKGFPFKGAPPFAPKGQWNQPQADFGKRK